MKIKNFEELEDSDPELEKFYKNKLKKLNRKVDKQKKKMKVDNLQRLQNEQVNSMMGGRKNKRKLTPENEKFSNKFKNTFNKD